MQFVAVQALFKNWLKTSWSSCRHVGGSPLKHSSYCWWECSERDCSGHSVFQLVPVGNSFYKKMSSSIAPSCCLESWSHGCSPVPNSLSLVLQQYRTMPKHTDVCSSLPRCNSTNNVYTCLQYDWMNKTIFLPSICILIMRESVIDLHL